MAASPKDKDLLNCLCKYDVQEYNSKLNSLDRFSLHCFNGSSKCDKNIVQLNLHCKHIPRPTYFSFILLSFTYYSVNEESSADENMLITIEDS